MEIVHHRPLATRPRLSVLLIDWSCRESLHTIDYLNEQTAPRDQYEIIWVEYYAEHRPELRTQIDAARARGQRPPVDTYAILGMPRSAYYHKHLLYNAGLLLARGDIVCICDSDAIVRPTFVASVLRQFEHDPNIVLHLDEVRNHDRRFYPFARPAHADIVGPGCANWLNGRPLGLSDRIDPLHTRNYGACMCARRADLIAIGGADMHMDYLGHICGPYEMTFRLANAGRREIWHPDEWLYHVWHPGQAGDANYAGPHDGRHLSTTALEARTSGRVEPLVPHPAVERRKHDSAGDGVLPTFAELVPPPWLREWDVDHLRGEARPYRLGTQKIALLERAAAPSAAVAEPPRARRLGRAARLRLVPLVWRLFADQLRVKRPAARLRPPPVGIWASAREPFRKAYAAYTFLRRMWRYNRHRLRVCWLHLGHVAALGHREVAFYGSGDAIRILRALAPAAGVTVRAVCPFEESPLARAAPAEVWTPDRLARYDGPVIVATFVNATEYVRRLRERGLEREFIIVLE